MIITFTGHSHIFVNTDLKEVIKREIRKHIILTESVTFYLGGYGKFDELCAQACRDLKNEYANVELVYVTPYISLSEQAKIKEMQKCGLCDTSIYPPIEKVPLRFAISKRNEWMMANADLIISYIDHDYGGAYKSFQIAKRKKKRIINICDFI